MAARSTLTITVTGEQDPPTPYTEKVRHTPLSINKSLLAGVIDDTFDSLYVIDDAALAASATTSHDLQTALDRYGNALTLTDVALLYIEHKSDSLASSINVHANAVNGFTNLLTATAAVTLKPGDFLLVGALTADNLVVGAANKVFDVTNDDGVNAAHYVLHVWGRK